MQYYTAVNTGVGFITYEDNERSHISGYPGDVWVTEDNQIWADRVGAVAKTKEEAQAIVDAACAPVIAEWHVCVASPTPWLCGPQPVAPTLP